MLNSEQGIRHRKKRCCDVEPVFANIKQNHGFRRFMLRGKLPQSTTLPTLRRKVRILLDFAN